MRASILCSHWKRPFGVEFPQEMLRKKTFAPVGAIQSALLAELKSVNCRPKARLASLAGVRPDRPNWSGTPEGFE